MHGLKEYSNFTCSEKENTNMVDRTGICEFEISMSLVDLLEVCLQETTRYAASEHDVFGKKPSTQGMVIGIDD